MPRSHRSERDDVDATFASAAGALAGNVRALRERRGITQQALAELADVSINYLQRVERLGMPSNVTLRLLATIATALDVSVYDLFAPHAVKANARSVGRPRGPAKQRPVRTR